MISTKLDEFFGIRRAGSSIGTEVRAGFTTWLTMAYILFVNADILGKAIQIPGETGFAQILTATALASALGCFVMGIWARYPFALAPGMGLNAFFAYTVVLTMGVSWQSALGAVFIAGILFIILSVTGLRTMVIDAIPLELKRATAVGIGLFLAIIGFSNAGLIVDHPATLLTMGRLSDPGPLLAMLGIVVIAIALVFKWRGAILLGVGVVAGLAILTQAPVFLGKPFAGFSHGVVAAPVWPADLFLAMDFRGMLTPEMLAVVFAFLFVDFFDTAGTLMGLAERVGYLDSKGRLEKATAAFTADAIATTGGAVLGVSPTTSYIESASGMEEGGRTGLTAVTVGCLFLVSIFFWPVASAIPSVATAPALIIVGAFMMEPAKQIDWGSYRTGIPAFLAVVGIPLTYSIANGIALGIISYALINGASSARKEVHPIMYGLAVILSVYLLWGVHH